MEVVMDGTTTSIDGECSQLRSVPARPDEVLEALRDDVVALVHNLTIDDADRLLGEVADRLQLKNDLEAQAAYADFLGYRSRQSKYFMSVNGRSEYQFTTQHSEGNSVGKLQIAAFFCFDNTTDGGETILMRVDPASAAWGQVREETTRIALGTRPLTPAEGARAKTLYSLKSTKDYVRENDIVLNEFESSINHLKLATVLAQVEKSHSLILGRAVPTYWDTVGSVDHAALFASGEFLKENNLLRQPPDGLSLAQMDHNYSRRRWNSGVTYSELFNFRMVYRLGRGDLIVFNNLSWAHGAANWTPNSGVRRIVAAFA